MGRRTGQPRLSVAERPGSTAPPPDKEGAEGAAEPEGARWERPEGARPEGAAPPTGTTAAVDRETSRLVARGLATRRVGTTTKEGKKFFRIHVTSLFGKFHLLNGNGYENENEKYSLFECNLLSVKSV
jgi:hypothetical protein